MMNLVLDNARVVWFELKIVPKANHVAFITRTTLN